jgi:hypothetical protein
MRKVMVSTLVGHEQPSNGSGRVVVKYVLTPKGEALFHGFGVDYEEFESGPGNYSTAIVEWPDGRVESVRADHVRFMDAV